MKTVYAQCSTLSRRLVVGLALLLSTDPASMASRRFSSLASASVTLETLSHRESGRDEEAKKGRGEGPGEEEWCKVGQLLPRSRDAALSSEWSSEYVVDHPYGCDCASTKSRYFCPTLGARGYPKWVPHKVANGSCRSVSREEMAAGAPFPPDFKVLFYGNSHMRQTVESIMCLFEDHITVKRVMHFAGKDEKHKGDDNETNKSSVYEDIAGLKYRRYDAFVPGGAQCRACFDPFSSPATVNKYEREMKDNQCIKRGEECRCNDDYAEFYFKNGAVAHYYFATNQQNKSIRDALKFHGDPPFSDYDAVFANLGNYPQMKMEALLDVAEELQAEGVQLFWLSTYEGYGELGASKWWTEDQVRRFRATGAKYVGIDRMASGLEYLTKGVIENAGDDPHFCMPGPTNEIGLLLLQLTWALYHHSDEHHGKH